MKSVLVLASALGALAAPAVPVRVSPGLEVKTPGHSVRAVPNPNFKASGQRALAKALGKYGRPIPEALRGLNKRAHTNNTGSVVANSVDGDVQYVCPVSVGGTTLNLDFDTGSADLWVISSLMSSSQTHGHNIYKPKVSPLSGASWDISYGDGSSASGSVYLDTVTIGGLTVSKQAVEAAKKASSSFVSDDSNDGLVGLAFGSINTVSPKKQKTFFENAMSSLPQSVFTADLKHNTPGSYDFGFIDQSKYSGEITWVDIDNSQGFWQFDAGSSTAIADTGTTLLLVGSSQVKAYYKKVSGAKLDNSQGGYTFPCSSKTPDFTVTLGENTATIPGEYMNYAPIEEGSSTCFGAVQAMDGEDLWIYGDIFFKSFFTVFDYGNNRFGWAKKA
ncbi:Type I transmembrane sorting receptor [Orbilia ellipsospora]|uniref:Type I transmembrane sorting receptor n=1 Tax=Orbilia ellipsospora TaxID=2528407 RepID=A0AAV9WS38_9PEZI